MSQDEMQALCTRVIKQKGPDHQLLKAVEECLELATAIMHYRDGKISHDEVVSELADVQIVGTQVAMIIEERAEDNTLIHGAVRGKLQRLKRRLDDQEE